MFEVDCRAEGPDPQFPDPSGGDKPPERLSHVTGSHSTYLFDAYRGSCVLYYRMRLGQFEVTVPVIGLYVGALVTETGW